MRSSKGFWSERCIELKNMVRQNGKPTILSAADYHWPDLFELFTEKNSILIFTTIIVKITISYRKRDLQLFLDNFYYLIIFSY